MYVSARRIHFLVVYNDDTTEMCWLWTDDLYWFWVQTVTGKGQTLSLYNFSMLTLLSPRNSVGGAIVRQPSVCGWVSEWVRECVRASVALYLVDTIATKVFVRSLSNFTCKLYMMIEGTLLILGHGVKGQGQLWHSVYKTLWQDTGYIFCPITFKLYM